MGGWEHYIPIRANLKDLLGKKNHWACEHDEEEDAKVQVTEPKMRKGMEFVEQPSDDLFPCSCHRTRHLCSAVSQSRDGLCSHICRTATGSVTKVPTTLPRGAQMLRQETAPVLQQPGAEPRISPGEQSFTRTTSLQKPMSIPNLSPTETPWENVTLNRCLFVAIATLVFTSGCQKLHGTLRGQRTAEEKEEVGLSVRRSGSLSHRQSPEPVPTLWGVMFWWLPDLDDEDDEIERERSKRGAKARASRGLRNKPQPDQTLMKQRGGKLKDRRAKKEKHRGTKETRERNKMEEPNRREDEEDEDEGNEDSVPKSKKLEEQKEKRKTHGG